MGKKNFLPNRVRQQYMDVEAVPEKESFIEHQAYEMKTREDFINLPNIPIETLMSRINTLNATLTNIPSQSVCIGRLVTFFHLLSIIGLVAGFSFTLLSSHLIEHNQVGYYTPNSDSNVTILTPGLYFQWPWSHYTLHVLNIEDDYFQLKDTLVQDIEENEYLINLINVSYNISDVPTYVSLVRRLNGVNSWKNLLELEITNSVIKKIQILHWKQVESLVDIPLKDKPNFGIKIKSVKATRPILTYQKDLPKSTSSVEPWPSTSSVEPWSSTSSVEPWSSTSSVEPWSSTSSVEPWSSEKSTFKKESSYLSEITRAHEAMIPYSPSEDENVNLLN